MAGTPAERERVRVRSRTSSGLLHIEQLCLGGTFRKKERAENGEAKAPTHSLAPSLAAFSFLRRFCSSFRSSFRMNTASSPLSLERGCGKTQAAKEGVVEGVNGKDNMRGQHTYVSAYAHEVHGRTGEKRGRGVLTHTPSTELSQRRNERGALHHLHKPMARLE